MGGGDCGYVRMRTHVGVVVCRGYEHVQYWYLLGIARISATPPMLAMPSLPLDHVVAYLSYLTSASVPTIYILTRLLWVPFMYVRE